MNGLLEYKSKLLENTSEAIVAFDLEGNIIFWNSGAQESFGYNSDEVLAKNTLFHSEQEIKELQIILIKSLEKENLCFKTQRGDKTGKQVNLIFSTSPIIENNNLLGFFAIIHNINRLKKASNLSSFHQVKENKRTFKVIRSTILLCLKRGKMTINQISNTTGINWKTVEKHLTYLIGRKMVDEVFSSEYVRIFDLTIKGNEQIVKMQQEPVVISQGTLEEVY